MLIQTRTKLIGRSQIHTHITMAVTAIDADRFTLEAQDGPLTHRVQLAGYELPIPAEEIAGVQVGDRIDLEVRR